ncbi:hypothetical protein B0H13DRAFT_2371260 [Mycena leptocephala]|nr:hypothetical protein B0H13DRAFT_2371260 [Mycena leptocephala]
MSSEVFKNRSVCMQILSVCCFREFAALSAQNRFLRSCANEVLFWRIVKCLAVNICWRTDATEACRVQYTRMLLEMMDGEGACIVGSSAQGLLCFTAVGDGYECAESRDLNILTNEAKLPTLIRLFRDRFAIDDWYRTEYLDRSEYRGLVSSVYTFRRAVTMSRHRILHLFNFCARCVVSLQGNIANVLAVSQPPSVFLPTYDEKKDGEHFARL